MVWVWKTKSLLFCLRYEPLIVFWRQNHITFIIIKTMSHDLLVHMAYYHTFNAFSFVRLCQNSCWTILCCFGFIKCFADFFNIMAIYQKGVPAGKIQTIIEAILGQNSHTDMALKQRHKTAEIRRQMAQKDGLNCDSNDWNKCEFQKFALPLKQVDCFFADVRNSCS